MFEKDGEVSSLNYRYIGIAFNTYIILAINSDMYIIDEKAAEEKMMYEKIKRNYYLIGEKDSVLMLLPDVIDLNNRQMGIFKDNKELFSNAGFLAEEFGDSTVKMTNVPEFCQEMDTKELFLNVLEEINTVARIAKDEIVEKFLVSIAKEAAKQTEVYLNKEVVEKLMSKLLRYPEPFVGINGKQIAIKMTKADIEKKFSRR